MQYDAGGLFQDRGLVRFYRFTPLSTALAATLQSFEELQQKNVDFYVKRKLQETDSSAYTCITVQKPDIGSG